MTDAGWVLVAIAVAALAFFVRRKVLRRFGKHRVARLTGELIGWNGYFLALAIGMIQTNGGWHVSRNNLETQSTWAAEWPSSFILASILALGSYAYLEHTGRHWLGDDRVDPFPPSYVTSILEAEAKSTREQCRQMARRLWRTSRRTHRALPAPLADFVNRYLDPTA